MSTPTPEQAAVLDAADRVRIVRAAPGCGKTWLVADAIRRELANWRREGGIAALSFTNVGGDEIRRAVGSDLGHPHFVGTLDSFVYRFIVKQFAHVLDPSLRRARLIAEHAEALKYDPRCNVILPDHNATTPVSLFDLNFSGGFQGNARLTLRQWGQATEISAKDCGVARLAKFGLWRKFGWMSYSDVAYIAAAVLRDATHGQRIRELVAARFPFFVVDELQDTGWYFSEIVRNILSVPHAKGLLVGDPDQAIFQFNGARPELFDTFAQIAGSKEFPIRKSLRCPSAVVNVANHLRSGKLAVEPSGTTGTAFLVVAKQTTQAIIDIRSVLSIKRPDKNQNIVARGNDAVEDIDGGRLTKAPEFSSRPLSYLHQGVRSLVKGQSRRALDGARSALIHVLLDEPSVDEDVLENNGIGVQSLRLASAQMLEAGRVHPADETVWSWGERMKAAILKIVQTNGWKRPDGKAAAIKSCPRSLEAHLIAPSLTRSTPGNKDSQKIRVRTIHGVKGETHDTTIVYVPPITGRRKCISETWWSSDPKYSEERRVAFVATTRSRQELVMCVTEEAAANLQSKRPDFYGCFQVVTPEEYIKALRA